MRGRPGGRGGGAGAGPINARVVSVYDGDTLTVDAEPWPGVTIRTAVQVNGVDTPEIRGKCQAEKDLAIQARDFVRGKVGERVRIANVKHGKYAGRVIADVLVGGEKLSDMLIAEGLGRPTKRDPEVDPARHSETRRLGEQSAAKAWDALIPNRTCQ